MAVSQVAAEFKANGPIGYWRLGGIAGCEIAADVSGNGNHGAGSGGIVSSQPGFHDGDVGRTV